MKMLFCIVQNEDAGGLVTALTKEGYRSTRYQSHGGFLRQGNATILVGAPDDKVSDVIAVVRRSCRTRTQYINPLPPMMEPGEFYMPNPVDVQLGGATIFVLDVAHFEQV
ncbi:MAG: cyclic-di-AMP receptor [Chloroflexota bacterium]